MAHVTIEEAKSHLNELIDQTPPGVGVVITRNGLPVAELVRLPAEQRQPVPGRCQGMLTIVADDEEHLKDWADYLP